MAVFRGFIAAMLTNANNPRFFPGMRDEPKTGPDATAGQTAAAADTPAHAGAPTPAQATPVIAAKVPEIGGPAGPEPTRYGDWERKGVCVDF